MNENWTSDGNHRFELSTILLQISLQSYDKGQNDQPDLFSRASLQIKGFNPSLSLIKSKLRTWGQSLIKVFFNREKTCYLLSKLKYIIMLQKHVIINKSNVIHKSWRWFVINWMKTEHLMTNTDLSYQLYCCKFH